MRAAVLTSLLFAFAGTSPADATADTARRSELAQAFEEQFGHNGRDVWFLHRGPGYVVRLGADGLVVEFPDSDPLRFSFDPPSEGVAIEGLDPSAGKAHWIDGAGPSQRLTSIPLYGGVLLRGVHPSMDLEIRATAGGIALAPVLARGAVPVAIRLIAERADERAALRADGGTMTLDLVASRGRSEAPAGDPVRLAVDADGYRYIAGRGRETNGAASAFVAKLGSDDASLVWVSRFPIDETDRIAGLGVLTDGRVALHGGSASEAWVMTLSSDGSELERSAAAVDPVEEPPRLETPPGWGPHARIDATVAAPGGMVVVAGRTSSRSLERGTIVGPTESGDSAFLALAAGCPGTINFDNSAGTGAWTTATNWDLDRLPIATDDVCIAPGFAVTLSSGTQSIQSLTTDPSSTLTLSSGSLTIASSSTIGGSLMMSGGTLDGAGELTISGLLTWTGGTMGGGGITNANGGISASGSAVKDLNPRVLRSPGTTTWAGAGSVRLGNGASIENSGTFTAQSDTSLAALNGGGSFTNAGTFRKSAGAGATTVTVAFDSAGAIDIQSGTLSLNGSGTAESAVTGSAGTTLRFNGGAATYTLGAASSLNVPSVVFDAGTVNVNGTYTASTGTTISGAIVNFNPAGSVASIGSTLTIAGGTANFASGDTIAPSTAAISSGTLTGNDTVTISGLLTWTGGAMTGAGITNANGGISVSGAAVKDINTRVLRSPGTTTWTGAGNVRLGSGASIENSGTWTAQSDSSLAVLSGGGRFTNSGTFRKSVGAGTTTVTVAFDSPGAIDIQSGTLSLNGSGTASSTITGSAGTTLRFNGLAASYTCDAASSVSAPSVAFDAGTVNVNGAYAASTGTTISGATVNFNPTSSVASIGSTLSISGGTANFASGETIAASTAEFSSGTLTGSDTVTIAGPLTWTGGTMTGGGLTNAGGGMTVNGAAVKDLTARLLRTSGTTTWAGAGNIRLAGGAAIENSGTWEVQSDVGLDAFIGGGTFSNTGTFRKSAGSGASTVAVPFANGGAVEALTHTLAFTGGFTQTAGSATLNGGTITSTSPLDIQGGSLRGIGTAGASVASSGTTSPGLSPAVLGIAGDWTQSVAGTYAVELGGTAPGTQHDRLDVTSVASLDGALEATFIGGFIPVAGDTFTILTAGSRTGTFATTNLPALSPLYVWNVIYKAASVDLKVVPLPSGRIPGDLLAELPLKVAKSGANLTLIWNSGCLGTDTDSEIYEGMLGSFAGHLPLVCSTGGATAWTFTPGTGNRYYLVVPTNGAGEGSYGLVGTATQRVVSTAACRMQSMGACP